ncbi:MAG TPA: ABC transporter substrate-binding protein, partial [Chloroflexota bacterium]|nr:ABC transporter substrate-binding protein [Chloroflexota bacterium]
ERARSLGISLLDIHMDRLADIDPVITKLGDAIGQKPKADQLLTQLHQQLAAVAKQVEGQPKVRTLIALDHTARYVVGPRNYLDDILTLAGGTNVAGANAKEYPEIDRETLLQLDPEAIILLLPEAPPQVVESAKSFFATLPQLKAVRTGRVYIHTQWYLLQPTARVRIVAQIIATDLHPLTATTPTTTTVAQ